MGLRDYLSSMESRKSTLRARELPPLELMKAVQKLEASIANSGGAIGEAPAAFVQRIEKTWSDTRSLAALTNRDLRGIAYFLYQEAESITGVLADDEGFVGEYLKAFSTRPSSLLARSLTNTFLLHFGHNPKVDRHISDALNGLPDSKTPPTLRSLRDAGIIDDRLGPDRLARLLSASTDIPQSLAELGISEVISRCAFVAAAYERSCRNVVEKTGDPTAAVQQIFTWATSGSDKRSEAFPTKTAATVDALLLPWQRSRIAPPPALQTRIKDFLVASLGDPRFRHSSARWTTLSEEARTVLKRWLNIASVTQFFDIVDDTMADPPSKRMWKYRRAFWTAYLEEVSDAWVVFGTSGAAMARDAARRSNDSSLGQFGKFKSSVSNGTQAVLILTIGNLRIAEWSHNGKCRMWTPGETAPAPYEKLYSVYSLRDAAWATAHMGAESYNWQRKFRDKIRSETGINKPVASFRI
jgi:hypothetical protein|tara:strand:- start:4159 stop:5565 length:1407 start_codon:yes stop_codon:yes gene_type:complete